MADTLSIVPELLTVASDVFELQETKLKQQIEKLRRNKTQMQTGSDVIQTLALAKKDKGGLDLNANEEVKQLVLCLHRHYPHLFDHLIQGFPEGLLSQPVETSDSSREGIIHASLEGVTLSEVSIAILQPEDIDAILRGLEAQLEIQASEVNQITFDINRVYGDREQMVKIMHEILDQMHKLLSRMNSNAKG